MVQIWGPNMDHHGSSWTTIPCDSYWVKKLKRVTFFLHWILLLGFLCILISCAEMHLTRVSSKFRGSLRACQSVPKWSSQSLRRYAATPSNQDRSKMPRDVPCSHKIPLVLTTHENQRLLPPAGIENLGDAGGGKCSQQDLDLDICR